MKHNILSLFLVLTFSSITSTKPLTAHDARVCLRQASTTDAQLLLNLIYWSYLRSATTIAAQSMIFDNLRQSWMLWLNAVSTRRNPRTPLPFPEVTEIDSFYANLAAQAQTEVNATYSNALKYTVEEDSIIDSEAVIDYMEAMRSEARTAIAQTVIDSLTNLETMLGNVQAMLNVIQSKKFIHNMHTLTHEMNEQKDKNFIDDGIHFILNNVALQAFAQFDKNYCATSDQFFNMLADSQIFYMQVWQQLETARAAYYQELYQTVYDSMVDLDFPESSFLFAIDTDGLIDTALQQEPLPRILL